MAAPCRRCLFSITSLARKPINVINLTTTRCLSLGQFNSQRQDESTKAVKISMAMKAYLERAQAHDAFMQEEITEYEIGKRHLARIMSADPDNFSQEDIDRAIEYLLPSGVFDKKARPLMKTMGEKLDMLKKHEDVMFASNVFPDGKKKIILAGSQPNNKKALEKELQEKLNEAQYKQFLALMERISVQPFAYMVSDDIFKYRNPLQSVDLLQETPELQYSESGRPFIKAKGNRKTSTADVTIWGRGTGDISVNGKNILQVFPEIIDRTQLLFPLQFTSLLGTVDVEAVVTGGGSSGQAGALRLALARGLQSMVDRDMVDKMRLAGLLTTDPRVKERKKPGQKRARKKFTWKKR